MRKLFAVVLLAALTGSMPLAVAAPDNDNFADATAVSALPFTETVDVADATNEPLEPMSCGPTTHTVWYTLTAAKDGDLIIDTDGSNFDTVLAVYAGDDLAALQGVACDDDSYGPGGPSRVEIWAEEGQTLRIQAGGWTTESGILTINVTEPGSISGTVTNLQNQPVQHVCVSVESSNPESPFFFVGGLTGGDGKYEVGGILPGDYKVGFWPCGSDYYVAEYYDDKTDWETADVVTVASGQAIDGIDAALALAEPPVLEDATDVAVTNLSVENVPLQTDGGNQGYTGWVRRVHVSVANLSEITPDRLAFLSVTACPVTTGRCTSIGRTGFEAVAGATRDVTFKWNGLGAVGDYTVSASVCVPHQESDYANNSRTIDHYVIVGGTGYGVGVTGQPQPPYFFECYDGVILAEPVRA